MTTTVSPAVPHAADQRRSIRKYTAEPISDSDLNEVLRLAGRAPSAWNLQPWRIVVVRDPALKQQLAGAALNQPQVTSAPAVLVIYSDMEDALARADEIIPPSMPPEKAQEMLARIRGVLGALPPAERAAWGNAQANILLGYLLLVAESLGYATSPMLGFSPDAVKGVLGLPATATIAALVAIGFADEPGFESRRRPIELITQFR